MAQEIELGEGLVDLWAERRSTEEVLPLCEMVWGLGGTIGLVTVGVEQPGEWERTY